MSKNIKLLEERVLQAAGRLRELSAERDQLTNELLALRQQLESAEQNAPVDSDDLEGNWQSQKAEVITLIRQTLSELRGN
jgi:outer membrane murein-binding lipoprotein Lpp